MDQDGLFSTLPTTEVGDESASLLEDVEMTSDHSVESAQYICVDTNVFLQRFGIVKALYTAFSEHAQGEVKLLIPFVVINELDGLTANHSPAPHNPQITISEAARAGTHWLLEANRARTGALRFQRWSERVDMTLVKGDDRVLDCCLYFRSSQGGGKGMVLWSDDRNLALLAGANDIPTIGGRAFAPIHLIDRLPLSVPGSLRDHLVNVPLESLQDDTGLDKSNDADGMELDLDLTPIPLPPSSLIPILMPSPARSASPFTDPTSQLPTSPFPFRRRTSPTKPSPPLPPSITSPIALSFVPFYDALPLPPTLLRRTFSPSSSPFEIVKTISKALEVLEKASHEQHRMNVDLLKTISAFGLLSAAIDPGVVSRRPRTGEVADALDELRDLTAKLGCPVDQEEISRLSRAVRDL